MLIALSARNSQKTLRDVGGMAARLAAERRYAARSDGSGFAATHPAQPRPIRAPAVQARFQCNPAKEKSLNKTVVANAPTR